MPWKFIPVEGVSFFNSATINFHELFTPTVKFTFFVIDRNHPKRLNLRKTIYLQNYIYFFSDFKDVQTRNNSFLNFLKFFLSTFYPHFSLKLLFFTSSFLKFFLLSTFQFFKNSSRVKRQRVQEFLNSPLRWEPPLTKFSKNSFLFLFCSPFSNSLCH